MQDTSLEIVQLTGGWKLHTGDLSHKITCAPNKDSDQHRHLPSLIRVFAVHMKEPWVLSYPVSTQRRLIRLGGCPVTGCTGHFVDLVILWLNYFDKVFMHIFTPWIDFIPGNGNLFHKWCFPIF